MITTVVKADRVSPPLKWAGGKKWLIPRLQEILAPHASKALVEPFCGGLNVALGLMPKKAILNDTNPHLINLYQCIKQGLEVGKIVPFQNDRDIYNQNRDRFNYLIESGRHQSNEESALLFYYLNRSCFNGLCRFNKSGLFNVPFGKYKTINYRSSFSEYQDAFKDWTFLCGDFSDLQIEDNDFLFADPPYDTPFTAYSAGGFGWNDQVRLAEWLSGFSNPIVTTNQATDRILELYQNAGFEVEIVDAPRSISCNGDRKPAKEMLATKNL